MANRIYFDTVDNGHGGVFSLLTVAEYRNPGDSETYVDEIKNLQDLIDKEHLMVNDPFYRVLTKNNEKFSLVSDFLELEEAKNFFYSLTR